MSNFILQALKGYSITIYCNGSKSRSFCYVSDLIDGFIELMNTPDCFTAPVNLGNPGEFTILELVKKIFEMTDSRSELVFEQLPMNDPKKRKPDITLVREQFGWEPKIKLTDGLAQTIDFFHSFIKNLAEGNH